MQQLRKFHNQVKGTLIETYVGEEDRVLDLGVGNAGDMHKYEKAGVARLLGVDPSTANLTEASKRIKTKSQHFQSLITLIHATGQDTKQIMKYFAATKEPKVDVVASFFSLTFLFESEIILDAFIYTIKLSLRRGGVLIGTCMDGGQTVKFLGDLSYGKTLELPNVYNITKLYSDDGTNGYGQQLQIHIDNTIVTNQTEYLVWFDVWKSKLEQNGFKLVSTELFQPPSELELAHFSQLFRSFVFVRET